MIILTGLKYFPLHSKVIPEFHYKNTVVTDISFLMAKNSLRISIA